GANGAHPPPQGGGGRADPGPPKDPKAGGRAPPQSEQRCCSLADRRLRGREPTRNSMTALADPGRRCEHDNPRDECGHDGIQQDFVENFNHSTLSHTRLPLRAAALGHFPAHWTAKCYEFDNKEVRNGTKKRIVLRCRRQPS